MLNNLIEAAEDAIARSIVSSNLTLWTDKLYEVYNNLIAYTSSVSGHEIKTKEKIAEIKKKLLKLLTLSFRAAEFNDFCENEENLNKGSLIHVYFMLKNSRSILGLEPSTKYSKKDMRIYYRNLILKFHPDKYNQKKLLITPAEQFSQFDAVTKAYKFLTQKHDEITNAAINISYELENESFDIPKDRFRTFNQLKLEKFKCEFNNRIQKYIKERNQELLSQFKTELEIQYEEYVKSTADQIDRYEKKLRQKY